MLEEPPLGPAIPVIEIEISVLVNLLRFLAIKIHVCLLTDPYFDRNFFEIFKRLSTTGFGRWATVELLGDKLLSFSCQFMSVRVVFSECMRIGPTVY